MKIIYYLILPLLFLGCESSSSNTNVIDLGKKLKSLEDDVFDLKLESILKDDYKKARFAPESSGFMRLDSSIASFFVSLDNIKPYGDGFKITLRIGNPNYADFERPTLSVNWGERFDIKKHGSSVEHEKALRKQEIQIKKKLRAGSWNTNEVILAPASKEEIGSIILAIDTPSVLLLR